MAFSTSSSISSRAARRCAPNCTSLGSFLILCFVSRLIARVNFSDRRGVSIVLWVINIPPFHDFSTHLFCSQNLYRKPFVKLCNPHTYNFLYALQQLYGIYLFVLYRKKIASFPPHRTAHLPFERNYRFALRFYLSNKRPNALWFYAQGFNFLMIDHDAAPCGCFDMKSI